MSVILAIAMEKSFHSSCQKTSVLMEYYRSLCNLGLVYLNESVSDTENGLYGESDFHILYRSIPLFRRSYTTIKVAEVGVLFLLDHRVEAPFSRSASLYRRGT